MEFRFEAEKRYYIRGLSVDCLLTQKEINCVLKDYFKKSLNEFRSIEDAIKFISECCIEDRRKVDYQQEKAQKAKLKRERKEKYEYRIERASKKADKLKRQVLTAVWMLSDGCNFRDTYRQVTNIDRYYPYVRQK